MAKKQKEKKLSKEIILSAAKQLFSDKGYRGTSLKDLTVSFGVSRPSIYYYFKSKVDILSELHLSGFNDVNINFDRILSTDLPTREKFRKILEIHVQTLANDIELQRIFYLEEAEMPGKVRKEIRKRRKDYTEKIIEVYKKGAEEGIFKKIDPKIAVFILLGACNWLIMWYSPKKSIDPKIMIDYLMTILTDGFEIKNK